MGKNKDIKICILGSKGAGKTTLLSAITKQTGKYVSTSDIEKQVIDTENYKVIELNHVINGTNYIFFEFPACSDCIKNENLNFDVVILVIDCTGGVPEDEIQDALNVSSKNDCTILTFINKTDDCNDEEMLELITMEITASLNTPERFIFCGSALKAIEESNQYAVDSIDEIISALSIIRNL